MALAFCPLTNSTFFLKEEFLCIFFLSKIFIYNFFIRNDTRFFGTAIIILNKIIYMYTCARAL